jgi:hypothetical protein
MEHLMDHEVRTIYLNADAATSQMMVNINIATEAERISFKRRFQRYCRIKLKAHAEICRRRLNWGYDILT